MDTQTFYRRVEIFKCILLSAILIILVLVFIKIPETVTVKDLKSRNISLGELPVVVVKDGRISIQNEEIKVKGSVTIENQPIEVTNRRNYRY